MSRSEDFNDDEYVAKLLAEDARKSSVRYASAGMSALLPKRPSTAAPKPNTRFLKTLVREADTHNAALKKKEELEARIRLRNIREKESDSRRGDDPPRPTKRRRLSDEDDRSRMSHRNPSRHETRRERRHGQTSSGRSRSPESRHRDRRKRYDTDSSDRHHHSQHDQPSSRHRSGSHDRTSNDRDRGRKPSDANKRHTRRQHESHSDRETRHQERSSCRRDDHKPSPRRSRSKSRSTSSSTTSDPVATLIGPLPAKKNESGTTTTSSPLRKRGRGFLKSETATSNIDHHFSTAYNPSNDTPETSAYNLASDDDDQDWDNALEALRDRRAWQGKQAERMREAGFGDEEIERWEKSAPMTGRGSLLADDGDVRDVKWRKRGEDKEWDSGKIRLEDPEDGNALPRTAITTALAPTPPRKRSRTDGKRVDDVWQRKDSALVRQFRKALG